MSTPLNGWMSLKHMWVLRSLASWIWWNIKLNRIFLLKPNPVKMQIETIQILAKPPRFQHDRVDHCISTLKQRYRKQWESFQSKGRSNQLKMRVEPLGSQRSSPSSGPSTWTSLGNLLGVLSSDKEELSQNLWDAIVYVSVCPLGPNEGDNFVGMYLANHRGGAASLHFNPGMWDSPKRRKILKTQCKQTLESHLLVSDPKYAKQFEFFRSLVYLSIHLSLYFMFSLLS